MRYTEFAEKFDAFDESEMTNAELAYLLELSNRVSQKLLSVAGVKTRFTLLCPLEAQDVTGYNHVRIAVVSFFGHGGGYCLSE